MLNILIGIWFLILIFWLLLKDYSKKREEAKLIPLSVFIPCYNDSNSIGTTIKSLYQNYPKDLLEVFVINDKSTDNSLQILEQLNKKYPFQLINNTQNVGKSESLNTHTARATHNTILFLDADTQIHKKNINDMLKRKVWKVVAVSCPYQPINSWFRPLMQSIEYTMMTYLQGAYNPFSTIGMRGGCIMMNKSAFYEVGRFSYQAIIEDMDMAFKLNKAWYKVEQSMIPIFTEVPSSFPKRWKQKIRRGTGGTQCFIKHRKIWIKNPLHVLFLSFFCLTIGIATFGFVKNWIIIETIINTKSIMSMFFLFSPKWWLITLGSKLWFTLFSLPYVLPLIKSWKQIRKIIYIIPYSLIYIPLFAIVNIVSFIKMLFMYKKMNKSNVRWW